MKDRLKRAATVGVASILLPALLTIGWAASPEGGAARLFYWAQKARDASPSGPRAAAWAGRVPAAARFRESESRGLLVETWVNGAGPFTFALDTGAGATILSRRTAAEARVEVESGGRGVELGGLSGRTISGAVKAFPRTFALGFRENMLPSRGFVVVAPTLPEGVDGVLDPAESFHPLGFVVDMPRGEIRAFDPRLNPLRAGDHPPGGATVRWLTDGRTRRPFVALDGGRRALLDTGSAYGLAVDEAAARALGVEIEGGGERGRRQDLGGGSVTSRRIRAATVNIGPLALRRVPTDLLLRAEKGAPVILGRDALRPFELVFDPASRLVMLKPGER
jgi:predicted aspartyl protease